MKLEALRTAFLGELKSNNYAAETLDKYFRSTKRFLIFLNTFHHIEQSQELSKPPLENYLDHILKMRHPRTGEEVTELTKYNYCIQTKHFLTWLARNEYTAADYGYVFTRERQNRRIIKNVLTENAVRKILALPDESTYKGFRDKVILEVLYNTGLRRSEVAALGIYDLNFEEHTIFVRQGKGKKDRVVPMGDYLERYLKEYLEKVRPAMLKTPGAEGLFVNNYGGPFFKKNFDWLLKKYQERATVNFTCHSFRHSFATHMLKHGAGLVHIQKILGHSEPSTTEIYTKVFPVDLRRIILEKHPRSIQRLAEEPIVVPTKLTPATVPKGTIRGPLGRKRRSPRWTRKRRIDNQLPAD